ncbi:MAG: 3-deoxy-7-phosphoheptulonate synthase, partial [Bacteroidia bacterium]|nr:3-deoxy-7-phosphoheptulonate synthase [Bacteroidia bacterium]
MIIQLNKDNQKQGYLQLEGKLKELKIDYYPVDTQINKYLICSSKDEFDIRKIGHMKGIADVHRVSGKHKLVSSKWKVDRTVIDCGDGVLFGDNKLTMMAGPCS